MTEVQDIPILKLIPQRPPFVMVDRLLETGNRTAVTEFVVRPDCLLVEDGALTSYGLLENMAQTCAARIGWLNLDRPVKIGVIGAVRDFRIIRRPAAGAVLRTTVTERESVMNMTLVDAVVEDAAGNTVMSAAAGLTGAETSWSVRNVDSQILFGTLPAGSYTYLIIAEDTTGASLCFASSFTVSDAAASSGSYWSSQDPDGAMLKEEAAASGQTEGSGGIGGEILAFLDKLF